MSVHGTFTALEGVDGVGKTALAQALCRGVSGYDFLYVPRRQAPSECDEAGRIMRLLGRILWESGEGAELSVEFWVHLQAAWFAAFSRKVLAPLLENGQNVIVDGWVYKHWSTLLLRGYDLEYLRTAFQGARRPDHVVLLRADIGALWGRSTEFTPFEMGLNAGYDVLGERSYVDFQSRAMRNLERFRKSEGWRVLSIGPTETVQESAARLAKLLASECLPQDEPRES